MPNRWFSSHYICAYNILINMENNLTNKNIKKWFNPRFLKETIQNSKIFKKISTNIQNNCRIFFAIERQIDKESIVEYNLDQAKNVSPETKKGKKKKTLTACLFILNILLVVLVFYNFAKEQGGIQPFSTLIANHPRWSFLFIALGLFILTTLFNGMKFLFLIHNKTKKWRDGGVHTTVTKKESKAQHFTYLNKYHKATCYIKCKSSRTVSKLSIQGLIT